VTGCLHVSVFKICSVYSEFAVVYAYTAYDCMHAYTRFTHACRLKKHVLQCDEIILATDEDREGEAISWHILQLLKPTVIPTDKNYLTMHIALRQATTHMRAVHYAQYC
jgi:5S rRNA maturation endonuclease (ribonuclease M5)